MSEVSYATGHQKTPGKSEAASRLAEIRSALIASGFDTTAKQAAVIWGGSKHRVAGAH